MKTREIIGKAILLVVYTLFAMSTVVGCAMS